MPSGVRPYVWVKIGNAEGKGEQEPVSCVSTRNWFWMLARSSSYRHPLLVLRLHPEDKSCCLPLGSGMLRSHSPWW